MSAKNGAHRDDERLITPVELAEILSLSEREIVAFSKAGVLRRETQMHNKRLRVVYDWRENVRRYVLHLRRPNEEARESYAEEKRATQAIVRQQKELELKIARGDMISRARVVLVMTALLNLIKNHLLGMPARVGRQLIMKRDQQSVRAVLDPAVRVCLIEANKFGAHSFDETGKNTPPSDDNEALKRAKKRVARRRRKS